MVTATKTKSELRLAKQIWLKPNDIGTVKVVCQITELPYFGRTQTVVRQNDLVQAKRIMKARPTIPIDIPVSQGRIQNN